MKKIPLIVIVGPTASGKTALSIELAKSLNGEIVSADSMQIYKEINIATAKPTKDEMEGIPHFLIDEVSLNQEFSVADYIKKAKEVIQNIYNRGKMPILVGGTGLYIDSLLNNINFDEQNKDENLRAELKELSQKNGNEWLWNKLNEFDSESAKNIHYNNVPRVIRAIEVYQVTGVKMSEQNKINKQHKSLYDYLIFGLNFKDRKNLYNRINLRVDKMIDKGLLEEAKSIIENHNNIKTAYQAIGYKEFEQYFDGDFDLESCVEKIKQESRRYAKRQLTWFRKNDNINWIYVEDYLDFKNILTFCKKKIEKYFKV